MKHAHTAIVSFLSCTECEGVAAEASGKALGSPVTRWFPDLCAYLQTTFHLRQLRPGVVIWPAEEALLIWTDGRMRKLVPHCRVPSDTNSQSSQRWANTGWYVWTHYVIHIYHSLHLFTLEAALIQKKWREFCNIHDMLWNSLWIWRGRQIERTNGSITPTAKWFHEYWWLIWGKQVVAFQILIGFLDRLTRSKKKWLARVTQGLAARLISMTAMQMGSMLLLCARRKPLTAPGVYWWCHLSFLQQCLTENTWYTCKWLHPGWWLEVLLLIIGAACIQSETEKTPLTLIKSKLNLWLVFKWNRRKTKFRDSRAWRWIKAIMFSWVCGKGQWWSTYSLTSEGDGGR